MSSGTDLQEMEVGTKQSKTAVNANAKAGEPIDTSAGNWEDLGGPTPENYKVDDDSAKLKTPGGNLKQVSDVVTNRKGKTAKRKWKSKIKKSSLKNLLRRKKWSQKTKHLLKK